jgi:hypothetical protein
MKYTSLKFGHCYANVDGTFAVCPLVGNIKQGYIFAASHIHPNMTFGTIYIKSRVVEDGHWIEVPVEGFNIIATLHTSGNTVKMPSGWKAFLPMYNSNWKRLEIEKSLIKSTAVS